MHSAYALYICSVFFCTLVNLVNTMSYILECHLYYTLPHVLLFASPLFSFRFQFGGRAVSDGKACRDCVSAARGSTSFYTYKRTFSLTFLKCISQSSPRPDFSFLACTWGRACIQLWPCTHTYTHTSSRARARFLSLARACTCRYKTLSVDREPHKNSTKTMSVADKVLSMSVSAAAHSLAGFPFGSDCSHK